MRSPSSGIFELVKPFRRLLAMSLISMLSHFFRMVRLLARVQMMLHAVFLTFGQIVNWIHIMWEHFYFLSFFFFVSVTRVVSPLRYPSATCIQRDYCQYCIPFSCGHSYVNHSLRQDVVIDAGLNLGISHFSLFSMRLCHPFICFSRKYLYRGRYVLVRSRIFLLFYFLFMIFFSLFWFSLSSPFQHLSWIITSQ